MARVLQILLIVLVSMLLWGLPYGLLAAAFLKLLCEAGLVQWRALNGQVARMG